LGRGGKCRAEGGRVKGRPNLLILQAFDAAAERLRDRAAVPKAAEQGTRKVHLTKGCKKLLYFLQSKVSKSAKIRLNRFLRLNLHWHAPEDPRGLSGCGGCFDESAQTTAVKQVMSGRLSRRERLSDGALYDEASILPTRASSFAPLWQSGDTVIAKSCARVVVVGQVSPGQSGFITVDSGLLHLCQKQTTWSRHELYFAFAVDNRVSFQRISRSE
jgi:hypothetical protein